MSFLKVLVRKRLGGPVIKTEKVEQVDPNDIPEEEEDITVCEVHFLIFYNFRELICV